MTKKTISDAMTHISSEYIEKAADYTKTKKARRPAWAKWAAMAACLCLVIAGVLYAGRGEAPSQPNGMSETELAQPETDQGSKQPEKANRIVINQPDGMMTADMDVQFSFYDTLSDADRAGMLERFEADTGLCYGEFAAQIPDPFETLSFYSVDVPADAERTEYIPHDYVFVYQTQGGGKIKIALCPGEEPLRDCLIICEHPEGSEIQGASVTIYGYQDNYMAFFSHDDIRYDIEAENITQAELEELLMCLLT